MIDQLQELQTIIKGEENRKYGIVVYVNPIKKYGLIESEGNTCIFFPNSLIWHCEDIVVLKNVEVSFVPIKNPDDLDRCKAIKVRLVEPERF